jgi:hypothetical protein
MTFRRWHAGGASALKPSAKGLLRFPGSAPRQKTLNANIFVQIRPVNCFAAPNYTPMRPFFWRPVRQTGEPGKWHCNCPTIRKIGDQRFITDPYILDKCFPDFRIRSIHAMTSPVNQCFPQPAFGSSKLHAPEATTPFQANGLKPELRCCPIPLHMDVGRLVFIGRVKEEPIWPQPKYSWQ